MATVAVILSCILGAFYARTRYALGVVPTTEETLNECMYRDYTLADRNRATDIIHVQI